MVGSYEDWFLKVTQELGKGYRRDNAKFLKSMFYQSFRRGLWKSRGQVVRTTNKEMLDDDSDSDHGGVGGQN